MPLAPEPEDFPYYPLLYFLIYKSRVQYNAFMPDVLTPPTLPAVSEVTFSIARFVKKELEESLGGRKERRWYYETAPHTITVTAREIEDFLAACTAQLYLALTYFLIGCENIRYFLVEFFKAIEVIENALGGERAAISALTPYGVVGAEWKRLKRYASDQQRPFDIGRHAPKGSDLRVIDVRRLLEEPLGREVFKESVSAVRQAIDAYLAYLNAQRRRA